MKRIIFALMTLSVCLWLAGCSGKTQKTDNGKAKTGEKSDAEKDKPKGQAQGKFPPAGPAAKAPAGSGRIMPVGELAQGIGRAAAGSGVGGGQRIGELTEAVGDAKVVKDLEDSKRLGALMRAVGLSSDQARPKDTPPEPEP